MREYEYDVNITGEWRRPHTDRYDYTQYSRFVDWAARRVHMKVTFDITPESLALLEGQHRYHGSNIKGSFTLKGVVRAPNKDEAINVALKQFKREMRRHMCRTPVLRAV